MKKQILFAAALTLCFGVFAANGLGQAAAEYSMTTAGAATASANGGTALGSAVNKATRQAAGRVAEQSSTPVERRRAAARREGRVLGVRPVPAEVRAAESTRALRLSFGRSDAKPVEKEAAATAPCTSSPADSSAGAKTNSPCKPETQPEYPSEIKLSFPKN